MVQASASCQVAAWTTTGRPNLATRCHPALSRTDRTPRSGQRPSPGPPSRRGGASASRRTRHPGAPPTGAQRAVRRSVHLMRTVRNQMGREITWSRCPPEDQTRASRLPAKPFSPPRKTASNRCGTASRDILVHMIEEYARHCGHADLLPGVHRRPGRAGEPRPQSPLRRSRRMSSTRLAVPVLRSRLETCEETVFSLITRVRAISA
jgi:hypothetical protein